MIIYTKKWREKSLHHSTRQDVHTFQIRLRIHIRLDNFHRIFRRDLSKFKLGVVKRPITCHVSFHTWAGIADVDEGFLAIDHYFVVTHIAAHNEGAILNEFLEFGGVEWASFEDLDLRGIGKCGGHFGSIATVAFDFYFGASFEEVESYEAGELAGYACYSDCGCHGCVEVVEEKIVWQQDNYIDTHSERYNYILGDFGKLNLVIFVFSAGTGLPIAQVNNHGRRSSSGQASGRTSSFM